LLSKSQYFIRKYREINHLFFRRCCYICANEKEIEWRIRIQENIIKEYFDEKLNYLKSLQQCLANIPISLYHLLCAINQFQPQFNKRSVSFIFILKY
jgi:hypothetical protein